MKSNFTMLVCLLFFANFCWGQINVWTWVGGTTGTLINGQYGTQGIAAASNMPGSREQGLNWTDNNGNFWLYGGTGRGESNYGALSDLWKYSPSTGFWTWVNGSKEPYEYPVYGTKGVADPSNNPGYRLLSSSFTDNAGNLWLFGGLNYSSSSPNSYLNDLWKYNIATNEWTWVSGSNVDNTFGIYGVKGNASPANMPGSRYLSSFWIDTINNNLWLYGGEGLGAAGSNALGNLLNDLWKYSLSNDLWTWVNGSDSSGGLGIYGTRGVYNQQNNPAANRGAMGVMDAAGKLWMFGGENCNALWKYDPLINQWAWMKGDTILSLTTQGIYNTMGVSNPANKPGPRMQGCIWKRNNSLWLFGGWGNVHSCCGNPVWNDLWQYDISTNNWTWMKGDSAYDYYTSMGNYGTQGVSSITNNPPTEFAAMSWQDVSGNFWMFGGLSQFAFNHLWKYSPLIVTPVHLLTFTAQLKDNKALLNWQVENEQNFDRYQIELSLNGKDFTSIGAVKAANKKEYSFTDINPLKATNYYRIRMVDKDGQFTYSPIRIINNSGAFSVSIYPNPAKDNLQVEIDLTPTPLQRRGVMQLQVLSMDGKMLLSNRFTTSEGSILRSINIGSMQKGSYLLKVISADKEEQVVKFEKL